MLVARAARLVGSRARGGRLVLQTRNPDHALLTWVRSGDPEPIMEAERARRRVLGFPPFGAVAELSGAAEAVRAALEVVPADQRVLGPSTRGAGLAALMFASDPDALADVLAAAGPAGRAAGRLRIAVDPPRRLTPAALRARIGPSTPRFARAKRGVGRGLCASEWSGKVAIGEVRAAPVDGPRGCLPGSTP